MRPRPSPLLLGVLLASAPATARAQAAATDASGAVEADTPTALPATDAVIVIELVPASPPTVDAPVTAYAPAASGASERPISEGEAVVEDESNRSFAIGVSGLLGLRASGDDVMPTWTAGIDLAFRVMPWARLAVRRIGYGQASTLQGERYAVEASPAIDLFVPLGEIVEPFAELGALVQARFGDGGTRFGIAPFVGAGLRIAALDWLAFEVEGALHVPATEHVLFGHELFPTASLLLQLGLGAEARF
ncbi:MAG: hypothetical protein K1X94_10215 [Sandaracinaceae bacterium]|nr:hypothetical protein [Sandaracinaceae bacterium]